MHTAKFYGTESSMKLANGSADEMAVSPTRLLAVAIRKRRELYEEKEADLKLQIFHTSMIHALCKKMGEGRAKNKRSRRRSTSRSQKRRRSDNDDDSQSTSEDQDSGFDSSSPSVSPPSPSSPPSQIVPYERSEFDVYDDLLSPYYRNTVAEPVDDTPPALKRRKLVECEAFIDQNQDYCKLTAEFNEDFGLTQLGSQPVDDRNRLPDDYSRASSDSDPSWVFDGRIKKYTP